MALIKCPECGKEVSDTAKTCVHCGYKLVKKTSLKEKIKNMPNKQRSICKKICLTSIGIIIFWLFIEITMTYYNEAKEKVVKETIENELKYLIQEQKLQKKPYFNTDFSEISKLGANYYICNGYIVLYPGLFESETKYADYSCTCIYDKKTKSAECDCEIDENIMDSDEKWG